MIRVKRSQVRAPAVLAQRDSKAAEERAKAQRHYEDYRRDTSPNKGKLKSYPFKVYKSPEVKERLEHLFHGKCAYCESRYKHIHPVDIEHFRPKAAVVVEGGNLIKPGYYWLASTWANLLPSCIDCNRSRTHDHGDRDPEVTGKANLFPIHNDRRRRLRKGAEKTEKRLLLDPCSDDPDRHLRFRNDGQVIGLEDSRDRPSPKGKNSIDTYGLNREELIEARAAIIERLKSQINHVEEKLDDVGDQRPTPRDLTYLAGLLRDLLDFMAETEEYAGMASQLLVRARILADLEPRLRHVLSHQFSRKPRGKTWAQVLIETYPATAHRSGGLSSRLSS